MEVVIKEWFKIYWFLVYVGSIIVQLGSEIYLIQLSNKQSPVTFNNTGVFTFITSKQFSKHIMLGAVTGDISWSECDTVDGIYLCIKCLCNNVNVIRSKLTDLFCKVFSLPVINHIYLKAILHCFIRDCACFPASGICHNEKLSADIKQRRNITHLLIVPENPADHLACIFQGRQALLHFLNILGFSFFQALINNSLVKFFKCIILSGKTRCHSVVTVKSFWAIFYRNFDLGYPYSFYSLCKACNVNDVVSKRSFNHNHISFLAVNSCFIESINHFTIFKPPDISIIINNRCIVRHSCGNFRKFRNITP